MNPVLRFVEAANNCDIEALTATIHPDFEMIVPQHPQRGFVGRAQEITNMQHMMTSQPEGRIEVLRMVEALPEIWIENTFTSDSMTMAACVIFEIDQETDTIIRGRYYSDKVEQEGPGSDAWLAALSTEQ